MKINTLFIVFVVIALIAPIIYLLHTIRTASHYQEEEMLWI